MASAVGRVLTIGAVVLAIPAACLGAIALYGKALSDSEVGLGTLVSPAEARARYERAHAQFLAMTPAQHLARARAQLDQGYDEATHTGGDFVGFEHHASAIPEGVPEHAAVAALRDEAIRRRANLLAVARARVAQHVRSHPEVSAASPARQQAMRVELARDVDQLSPRGLGCVHSANPTDSTLRFDQAGCDQGMLDAIVQPDNAAALRTFGFRRVRCANGRGAIAL